MPADDLVLNVRQIAGYPPAAGTATGALLMQIGGLGGPYQQISPQDLVGTALAQGGDMAISGALSAISFQSGEAQFSNAYANTFGAQTACIENFSGIYGSLGGVQIATVNDIAASRASSVASFNGRIGNVTLWIDDILCAGGAPIYSPRFQGEPRACTPPPTSNSSRLATTAFVQGSLGQLTLDFAPIDSPNFTGNPTAPTAALGSSDGQLATTAFVQNAVASGVAGVASFNSRTGAVVLTSADLTATGGALLASPTFTGIPASPTAAPGTNTTQLATTAFVQNAVNSVVSGVSSFNSRTGAVTLNSTDISGAGGALVASTVASFNGRTGAVFLLANDISAASGALLASPAFTGTPSAPTPPPGDSSTRLATTAFIQSLSGFAPLASPAFTGAPTAPTAVFGTNTTQLATTAFVAAAISGSTAGVSSFNSRTGAVTLQANDISAAGGALLASPALTGTPTAPTAALGVSSTQLATTAYVLNAASTTTPLMDGTAAIGNGTTWARSNHVHPTDSSRAAATALANYLPLAGGTLTGLLGAVHDISYSYTPGTAFGFAWNGGGAGSGITAFVGGLNQGLIVRSGAPSISTLTTIDLMGLSSTGPTVNWYYSGGSVTVPVSFSDRRLKTNTELSSADALGLIEAIEVYGADVSNPLPGGQTEHWDCVLVADQVGAVIPPAWIKASGDQGSYDSISAYPIVCALVRAVQQLTARLTALEARTA